MSCSKLSSIFVQKCFRMKESNATDRLTYLAEQFDIFDCSSKESLDKKLTDLKNAGYNSAPIKTNSGKVLAIISIKINEKNREFKKTSVCSDVFSSMIAADPTEHKMYLQWMLNLFTRLIKGEVSNDKKNGSTEEAIRLVEEDLPQANAYLRLFEDNKRKKKFKDLCETSYNLKHVTDPTNINQYKSLAQLFDAVDPFIEKEPSAVERTLQKFVDSGQAIIPVKDRKFTLYIPKTTAASVVFNSFANWCTAREGNGMFNSYTTGHKKPNGKNSDIYIIINNKFFTKESEELYQIHFETKQLKDRKNSSNVSIFEPVLSESEGLANFFYEELMGMAKDFSKGIDNNFYVDYLIQFGFADSLFELIDPKTPVIKFMKREIPKIPDVSRFTEVDQFIINDAKLSELHPSIGSLPKIELLSLTNNKLKTLPKEIGNLKSLCFLNIMGNPIKEIPSEIGYLDTSRGGSLFRIAVDKDQIGEKNYKKLKELLPNADPFISEK